MLEQAEKVASCYIQTVYPSLGRCSTFQGVLWAERKRAFCMPEDFKWQAYPVFTHEQGKIWWCCTWTSELVKNIIETRNVWEQNKFSGFLQGSIGTQQLNSEKVRVKALSWSKPCAGNRKQWVGLKVCFPYDKTVKCRKSCPGACVIQYVCQSLGNRGGLSGDKITGDAKKEEEED